jgi:hypothetical protein
MCFNAFMRCGIMAKNSKTLLIKKGRGGIFRNVDLSTPPKNI